MVFFSFLFSPGNNKKAQKSDKWTSLQFLWPLGDPSTLVQLLIYVTLKGRAWYLLLGTLCIKLTGTHNVTLLAWPGK